jgi:hypothetical protein
MADALKKNPRYKGKITNYVSDFVDPRSKRHQPTGTDIPNKNNKDVGDKTVSSTSQKKEQESQNRHPKQIPKPTHAHKVVNQATRDEPIWKDTIFGPEQTSWEDNSRTSHTPSLSSIVEISKDTISHIYAQEPQMEKVLLQEAFHYYVCGLAWLRIVSIKQKEVQAITVVENNLYELTKDTSFNIPEPIFLYLQAIGKIECKTGQHLTPSFPPMPEETIRNNGGYFGPMNQHTHLLYEEIPSMGVLGEGLRRAISNADPGPYNSNLALLQTTANSNLLGFEPLTHRRNEAKNAILMLGVTEHILPSSFGNTGFNFPLMTSISNTISVIKSFKIMNTPIQSMDTHGSQAMQVATYPTDLSRNVRNVLGENFNTSLSHESPNTYGLSIIAGFHRYKNSTVTGRTRNYEAESWSCLTFNHPNDARLTAWLANRDSRRNLPNQFTVDVFKSITTNAAQYRDSVVKRLQNNMS